MATVVEGKEEENRGESGEGQGEEQLGLAFKAEDQMGVMQVG